MNVTNEERRKPPSVNLSTIIYILVIVALIMLFSGYIRAAKPYLNNIKPLSQVIDLLPAEQLVTAQQVPLNPTEASQAAKLLGSLCDPPGAKLIYSTGDNGERQFHTVTGWTPGLQLGVEFPEAWVAAFGVPPRNPQQEALMWKYAQALYAGGQGLTGSPQSWVEVIVQSLDTFLQAQAAEKTTCFVFPFGPTGVKLNVSSPIETTNPTPTGQILPPEVVVSGEPKSINAIQPTPFPNVGVFGLGPLETGAIQVWSLDMNFGELVKAKGKLTIDPNACKSGTPTGMAESLAVPFTDQSGETFYVDLNPISKFYVGPCDQVSIAPNPVEDPNTRQAAMHPMYFLGFDSGWRWRPKVEEPIVGSESNPLSLAELAQWMENNQTEWVWGPTHSCKPIPIMLVQSSQTHQIWVDIKPVLQEIDFSLCDPAYGITISFAKDKRGIEFGGPTDATDGLYFAPVRVTPLPNQCITIAWADLIADPKPYGAQELIYQGGAKWQAASGTCFEISGVPDSFQAGPDIITWPKVIGESTIGLNKYLEKGGGIWTAPIHPFVVEAYKVVWPVLKP